MFYLSRYREQSTHQYKHNFVSADTISNMRIEEYIISGYGKPFNYINREHKIEFSNQITWMSNYF